MQAQRFLDSLTDQGIDPAPFEQVLHEQLDKFGAGDLLNPEAADTMTRRGKRADNAFAAYQAARDAGKPGTEEGVEMLDTMRDHAHGHRRHSGRHA